MKETQNKHNNQVEEPSLQTRKLHLSNSFLSS